MSDYAVARRNMVESQLRTNRIDDPGIIEAMLTIPRELFVPPAFKSVAYTDEDLAFGDGRRLIEPLALAKLLQSAAIRPDQTVLVIGCDTGYAAAVAGRLGASVQLLTERHDDTTEIDRRLRDLGIDNVSVETGRLKEGLPAKAPFDVILLAGSVRAIPSELTQQLKEGGRLACVVQDDRAGRVTIATRVNGTIGKVTPFDAWLPELVTFRPAPSFVF
ncbi:protein-L-isoaspartate(D-aspartate) O-methyltransferase [Arboricoccus pini]|uniref:Protein-L-isoaspartate O-methyltransferase n=1 Tax=Arboricoccus pini TaxID=1963835 RepID=A0A212QPR0_9PROT|nr:protein-L-isoaspartate O-methyltransferase [Arboricoccus pini]SNB61261.1 protein-L-isoaspartate(D-aspartate) O-methyltransferase [Arboricoccus pini]